MMCCSDGAVPAELMPASCCVLWQTCRSTTNRHLIRSVANAGAGACELFDSKAKSKWERKV